MPPRDAQATQGRILDNAEAVFVERGFDAARIDDIAARAHANKRMIYVYFGDKEGLYQSVLERAFARVAAALATEDSDEDPLARAVALIRRYFTFLADNPAFVRLASWESLSHARLAGRVLAETTGAALARLHAVVERGVERGVFRPDLDPRKLALSVHAVCLTYFAQRDLLSTLWQIDTASPDAREAMLQHIITTVLDGIRVQGGRP
jgi:TetR/AcrR family transcriptional regulator